MQCVYVHVWYMCEMLLVQQLIVSNHKGPFGHLVSKHHWSFQSMIIFTDKVNQKPLPLKHHINQKAHIRTAHSHTHLLPIEWKITKLKSNIENEFNNNSNNNIRIYYKSSSIRSFVRLPLKAFSDEIRENYRNIWMFDDRNSLKMTLMVMMMEKLKSARKRRMM